MFGYLWAQLVRPRLQHYMFAVYEHSTVSSIKVVGCQKPCHHLSVSLYASENIPVYVKKSLNICASISVRRMSFDMSLLMSTRLSSFIPVAGSLDVELFAKTPANHLLQRLESYIATTWTWMETFFKNCIRIEVEQSAASLTWCTTPMWLCPAQFLLTVKNIPESSFYMPLPSMPWVNCHDKRASWDSWVLDTLTSGHPARFQHHSTPEVPSSA